MTQLLRDNNFDRKANDATKIAATRHRERARAWTACVGLLLATWIGTPARAEQIDSFTEPYRTIDVASPEPGIVATVKVSEGEPVRQGQLLVTLNTDMLMASLEIAKAQLESTGRLDIARAEQKLCATRLEKLRELRAKGHAGQNELESAQTNFEVADAKVRLAEEEREIIALEVKKTETQIRRRSILSPADGVVITIYREEGEAILAGDPTVLTFVQLDPLLAKFSVSVEQASRFSIDEKVEVTFSDTDQQVSAKVRRVAPITDAESGTVLVTLTIDNSERRYRSGMRCVLEVPGDTPKVDALGASELGPSLLRYQP